MKMSFCFLMLLLGSALASPVPETKEINAHELFPYGIAEGDMENPKEDDGISPKIHISKPFTFYGKSYHDLYVNNNGVISMAVPVPEYTPEAIPITNGKCFVAPFWGDVNIQLGGNVFYREVNNHPEILENITKSINKYFPDIPFSATWAFIATWDHVAFFGSLSKKTNTFQAILTSDHQTSFTMFIYKDIQWTTGAASGGNRRTGLGGIPAQAGFNSGDDKNYFSIPGSRTSHIVNITQTSNVNVSGHWVFQVDEFKVTGISEELLNSVKEEEPAKSNEEQGQQDNQAELPEGEGSQVSQGSEATPAAEGQQEEQETEPVPSENVPEEEEPQVSQNDEFKPEVEGQQEQEETEPIPSENVPEEEEPQVSQNDELKPEVEGQQEQEETEPVPSENVPEDEEPQVSQNDEFKPEEEGQQEQEETEPVPSENLEKEEESQVSQGHEEPEEGPQEEEGNGNELPEIPQKPTPVIDDYDESEDCEE
ncbi:nidogen-1-like [Eublepharis macularius]|uniref:Nidogen-1-like n=1 Tax=Eublepharis macularius TaxID=481883 RepID=A0AA97KHF7_EUBMA|nr:nidogen-1-like [Eublepharis macularius]XP_054855480.1 nidogen-1-like [Eublepharis macularius]